MLLLAFVLSAGVLKVDGVFQRSDFQKNLTKVLTQFCPNVNICGQTNVIGINNTLETFKGSCCTECSCSDDCDATSDCCFPRRNTKRIYHTCYLPTTQTISAMHKHHYRTYNMVDNCPSDHHTSGRLRSDCGDTKVAPWGSMMPVYSKAQGKLFKNKVCADCHNVADIERWWAALICGPDPDTRHTISSAVLQLLAFKTISDNCHVTFYPPDGGSTNDLHKLDCYNVKVSDCRLKDFDVPDWISLSKDEIVKNCLYGLWSPYFVHGAFKNIFCCICSSPSCISEEPHRTHCTGKRWPYVPRRTFDFTVLLKPNLLRELEENDVRKTHIVCRALNVSDCKHEYCPIGQLYNANGACVYPSVQLKSATYSIYLKLTLNRQLDMSETDYLISKRDFDITEYIQCSFPRTWTPVTSLFYSTHDLSEQSDHSSSWFIVSYENSQLVQIPTRFYSKLHDSLKKPCMLLLGNTSVELHSEFSDLASKSVFITSSVSMSEKHAAVHQNFPFPFNTDRLVILKYELGLQPSIKVPINRLYFCKMVKLLKDEVEPVHAIVIRHIYSGQFFFDNDFVEVRDKNGEVAFMICLEDLGYVPHWTSGVVRICVHLLLFLIAIFVILNCTPV